jgi:hypothetical protein
MRHRRPLSRVRDEALDPDEKGIVVNPSASSDELIA